MPPRPSPARLRELLDEIIDRRRQAADPTLDELGEHICDILAYLRKHPASRPQNAAADGLAALELIAELRWQQVEFELDALDQLHQVPQPHRPTNSTVATRLGNGLVPQSVRDRRARHRATLDFSERSEHLIREQRRAERTRHAVIPGLHQARADLLAVPGLAEVVSGSTSARGWLVEVQHDHATGTAGSTAQTVLTLLVDDLTDLLHHDGIPEPNGLRTALDAIAQLARNSSR